MTTSIGNATRGPRRYGEELTRGERFLCPICEGYGEVGTGKREPDTGVAITEPCPPCRGAGEVGRAMYEDLTSETEDPDPPPRYSAEMCLLLGLSDLPPF